MPDKVVKTGETTKNEKSEYSAGIINNSVVIIRNGMVWKSQNLEYLNWYSHVNVLIHNNTIYAAIIKEKGIVGIEGFIETSMLCIIFKNAICWHLI